MQIFRPSNFCDQQRGAREGRRSRNCITSSAEIDERKVHRSHLKILLFTKNEFRHQAIMNIAQRRGAENDQLQLQLIYTNYRARWCAFAKSRTAIHRKRCSAERFSLFEENFRRCTVTVRRSKVFAVAFLQKAVARACAVVLVDVSALCTRRAHTAPPKAFPAVGLGWLQSALARQPTASSAHRFSFA